MMNNTIREQLENLRSEDRQLQNQAFTAVLKATDKPVDWAYEAWDDLVRDLRHKDNHVRAIAAQVLSNLAKSDPQNRMKRDFPALLAVTKDERFVTARHTMQSLWKVGAAGETQRKMVVEGLSRRYKECASEKNRTLIRYDIIVSLHEMYNAARKDPKVKARALELIETEPDLKYRKKYAGVWREA